MLRMSVIVIVLIPSVLLAAGAPSATPATSPESVTRLYMKALQASAFDDAAVLMDPGALSRFKDMLLPVLLEAPGSPDGSGVMLLDGVKDRETAKALSGSGFLAAFFRGLSKQNPAFAEGLRSSTGDIVGTVSEGTNTVHVVCRASARIGELSLTKMTVITLVLTDGAWRVALSGELEGMGQALKKALPGSKGAGGRD